MCLSLLPEAFRTVRCCRKAQFCHGPRKSNRLGCNAHHAYTKAAAVCSITRRKIVAAILDAGEACTSLQRVGNMLISWHVLIGRKIPWDRGRGSD